MASKDPQIKNIQIKTGVVKRIAKEKVSYQKERDQQEAKVNKMKDDGADEHDVKKQIEVLQESEMMIPDCQRRLVQGWDELNNLLAQFPELTEAEEYKAAQNILEENRAAVGK